MTRPDSRRRARVAALLALLSLLAAACGTRQSHDQVVAALGAGAGAAQTGTQAAPGGDASSPDTPVTGGPAVAGPQVTSGPAASTSRSDSGVGGGTGATKAGGDHTPLVIGEVGTFSGLVGAGGVAMRMALRAWVQWVNAQGGLAGHPVKLISIDDQGNTSKAQAAVRKLVEQDHVQAIVASYIGLTIKSIEDYVNAKGVPMIGGDMASYDWFRNRMFFPQGTHVAFQLYGVLQQIAASQKPKAALFYCAEAAICAAERAQLRAYAPSAHVDVVYEAQVSLAQPDFTAQCLNARRAGAQTVIVVMDGGSMRRITRDCVRQSYRPDFWTGAQVVEDDDKNDPNMDGVQVVTMTFGWILSSSPGQATFQATMHKYAPGTSVDGSAAMGWTAAELLRAAVTSTGARATSGAITTKLILDGLYSVNGTTVGGLAPALTIQRGGKRNPGGRCFWSMALHDGRWTMRDGGKQSCVPASIPAP